MAISIHVQRHTPCRILQNMARPFVLFQYSLKSCGILRDRLTAHRHIGSVSQAPYDISGPFGSFRNVGAAGFLQIHSRSRGRPRQHKLTAACGRARARHQGVTTPSGKGRKHPANSSGDILLALKLILSISFVLKLS